MLTSLQIANFKGFADAQRIPVRPLTLIFGPNSSGKSSIIHSIVLARHAMETGDLDAHRTNVGGESVDLGGFRQYIHRRDLSRRMEWSVELDTASLKGRLAELLAPVKRLTADVIFGLALDNEGRPVADTKPQIHSYEIFGDGSSLFRMSKRSDGQLQLDRLEYEHPVFRQVVTAIIETSTTATSIESSDYETFTEAITSVVPEITANPGKFLAEAPSRSDSPRTEGQATLFPVSRGNRREDLTAALRFFLPRTVFDLIRGIESAVGEELGKLEYLGPLRSYPPRHLAFSQHQDPNWFAGGGYAWDKVRREKTVRKSVNAWLMSEEKLQTPYELVVRELVGIDDLDAPFVAELAEIVEGLTVDEREPAVTWPFDPEVVTKDLKSALRRSGVEKLPELVLMDRRTNTVVSHRDVGIGISQVLPVLVAAYGYSNKLLAMEQPEIHLHPQLQAELGDVFITSALGGQKNTFLLETHSEHLILRVMRRLRESYLGKLPPGLPPIKPEDVCVLFVEPARTGSYVREMPLNERGDLVKAWPGGFFEEGLREVLP